MTIPDQPSALSKEELAGLLDPGHKQSDDAADAKPYEPEPAPPESVANVGDPGLAGALTTSAADDDMRMVLDHWERTVAGLQLELIELRSRVARLEQQLGEEPARQTPPPASGSAGPSSRTVAGSTPATVDPRSEEEPSPLSRVRTYRSKRGWF